MDKFVEKYNLPKLNEEEAQSLNRHIRVGEIKAVIKKSQHTKALDQTDSKEHFTKPLRRSQTLSISDYSKNIQEEGRLPNSFDDTNIILIPKPDQDTKRKEN